MARKITIRDVEPQLVELGDHTYKLLPVVKSRLTRLNDIGDEINQLGGTDDEKAIAKYGEQLDVLLAVPEDAKNKAKVPPASEVITSLWDGEEISQPQLEALVTDLRAAGYPS